jgi:uncharacterized OsmC-like protein
VSLITVAREKGLSFRAAVRGHAVTADMWGHPVFADAGPSPAELFVMAIGTCIGMHVALFCEHARCSAEGLGIALTFGLAKDGESRRVTNVYAEVEAPGIPPALAEEAERAARAGVIPATLRGALELDIVVRAGEQPGS